MSRIIGTMIAPVEPEQAQQQYLCSACGKAYKTEKGLADHMAKEHASGAQPGGCGEETAES